MKVNSISFKDGEKATEDKINKSDEFIEGYRSYYSAYSLWVRTKSYRDDLPDWMTPWKKN